MAERTYIMRVVPRSYPAAGWEDDYDECDLDKPCDLVMLTIEDLGHGDIMEREIDRKPFEDGHAASRHLGSALRGTR